MSPEKRSPLIKENASTRFLRDFEGKPQEFYSYLGAQRLEGKLDNGLKVVLLKKSGPKVSILASTVGGGRHDEGELAGRAHFNEHMITSGTADYPRPESLTKVIEDEGGYFNAFTSSEEMAVDIRVNDLADVPQAMEVISQCLTKSIYDPDTLESERGAVLQEMSTSDTDPESRLWTEYQKAFFPGTPLETPVLGDKKTVSALTGEKLKEHSEEMFVANKMVLVVAGNLAFDKLMDHADRSFGFLPRGNEVQKSTLLPEVSQDMGITIRKYKDTERVIFNLGVRTIPKLHPDSAPLEIFAEVMGGGGASVLMKKLRYDKGTGLVYGAYAHNDTYSDAGALVINCSTTKDKFEKVLDITTGVLKDVRENGVPAEDIDFAKNRMTKLYMGGLETNFSWARRHSSSELLGLRVAAQQDAIDVFKFPLHSYIESIAKVTPEDVSRVAQEYLKPEKLRIALCGDIKKEDIKLDFN